MTDQIQPWPVLKQGSRGHPVPALQYLLRGRGHLLTVDGIFGPKTEAAVEGFQTADQIRVDGIVGPQTWSALIIVVATGSTGDAVRGVQEEFRFRDLSGVPGQGLAVDGVFGPKTGRRCAASSKRSGSPPTASSARLPGGPSSAGCCRPDPLGRPLELGRGGAERAGRRNPARRPTRARPAPASAALCAITRLAPLRSDQTDDPKAGSALCGAV